MIGDLREGVGHCQSIRLVIEGSEGRGLAQGEGIRQVGSVGGVLSVVVEDREQVGGVEADSDSLRVGERKGIRYGEGATVDIRECVGDRDGVRLFVNADALDDPFVGTQVGARDQNGIGLITVCALCNSFRYR